ncbi:hypothetical protein CDAR_600631 [Caerostris darwini]|uniref:Secreted protein n=1 Tax=Caerostris darwini TaxID=1538125 RepID=A0AAV4TV60_9ARAC|nr:hypothetical protein CDAR_600631 [Caerostris darwini]
MQLRLFIVGGLLFKSKQAYNASPEENCLPVIPANLRTAGSEEVAHGIEVIYHLYNRFFSRFCVTQDRLRSACSTTPTRRKRDIWLPFILHIVQSWKLTVCGLLGTTFWTARKLKATKSRRLSTCSFAPGFNPGEGFKSPLLPSTLNGDTARLFGRPCQRRCHERRLLFFWTPRGCPYIKLNQGKTVCCSPKANGIDFKRQ